MLLLLVSLAFAEEPQFTSLQKGQPAPFDGRLFNGAAVAKLITDNKYKNLECSLQTEYELNKLEVRKNYEIGVLRAELKSENEMLKQVNQIKQEELGVLRKAYKPAKPFLWMSGGFVLGSAASIAIFHAVK